MPHCRASKKGIGRKELIRRVVVGMMDSGKKCTLAESIDSGWSLVNSPWSLLLPNTNNDDGHLFELTGPQTVSFPLEPRILPKKYYGVCFLCIGL